VKTKVNPTLVPMKDAKRRERQERTA
jgi:hypothetical protein